MATSDAGLWSNGWHNPRVLFSVLRQFQANAAAGKESLWKVWWVAGIPVAWTTTALVLVAEELRLAGHHGWGDFSDVLRLLVYLAWCRLAWRCSGNAGSRLWTVLARAALSAGLVLMAIY